jgi:NADPH-dependent 2,4-dienoyl-CoA reductase/sulfur reductase-like enzyme
MGGGIAEVCARAGVDVTVFETSEALLNAGLETFLDINDLQPGCDWPGELVDKAAAAWILQGALDRLRSALG